MRMRWQTGVFLAAVAIGLAGCNTDMVTGIFKTDKKRPKAGQGNMMPMQQEADPVNPVKKPEMGIEYDPRDWIANTHHPNRVSQMITSRGFKGITQQTFAETGGDFNAHLDLAGGRIFYSSTRWSMNPQICMQGVTGKAVTVTTDDQMADMMPKISPNGSEVAWCSNRYGNWDILVQETENKPDSRPRQLTRSTDDDIHPTWSPLEDLPDGSKGSRLLAFSRFNSMDGVWQLWVMNYSTRTLSVLGEGLFPEFCPVIKKTDDMGNPVYTIAFQRARRRDVPFYSIWTLDVRMGKTGAVEAVGSPREIVANDKWAAINPSWSPDGNYMTFATVAKSALSQWQARLYRADDIWVIRIDGTDLTQITSHAAPDWDPWWAADPGDPNGPGRIYFTSERSGVANIWSVKPIVPGMLANMGQQGMQ